jgi:hypothetical protein
VKFTPAFRRFASVFGSAFGLIYVIARAKGFALFTLYPSLGIVLPGTHRSRDVADPVLDFLAPEMFWYGWTTTAALGALAISSVAVLLPVSWYRLVWPGWVWVAPILAMMACVYLTIPWFRQ